MSVRRRSAARTAAALTGVAALALSGCGGSGKADTAAPQAAASVTPTPKPTPTTALQPTGQKNAFLGLRKSAAQLTDVGNSLALGLDRRGDEKGDAGSVAAGLTADLTYLLTEHVYLTGVAVLTAYEKSASSAAAKDAVAALDENSKALAALLHDHLPRDAAASAAPAAPAVPGTKPATAAPGTTDAFLEAWRAHVQDVLDYAAAVQDDNSTDRRRAEAAIDAYRVAAGDFFAKATDGGLPAYKLKPELKEHFATLRAAIDAFAADDDKAFDLLKAAGDRMAQTASVMAKGILAKADDRAGTIGSAEDEAAVGRARLAGLTTAHTYLTGVAMFTAFSTARGVSSVRYITAKATLDDNSKELAAAVRDVSTSEREVRFLEGWRGQILDLERYTSAAADGSRRARDAALDDLDAYQKSAATFFAALTRGGKVKVTAEDFSDELTRHLESFTGTIDALRAILVRPRSS